MVVVTGITVIGEREVLGCAVGDTETEPFWSEFFRSLRGPGLTGVRLVISDHHEGLKSAIAKVLIGASWQRCRVHFMRNVLAKVPKADAEMVAAAIRTIFAQLSAEAVWAQFDRIVDTLEPQFPQVGLMLVDAREDLLAFSAFPFEHWRKIWSTNPAIAPLRRCRLFPTCSCSAAAPERRCRRPASLATPAISTSPATTPGGRGMVSVAPVPRAADRNPMAAAAAGREATRGEAPRARWRARRGPPSRGPLPARFDYGARPLHAPSVAARRRAPTVMARHTAASRRGDAANNASICRENGLRER